MDNKHLVIDKVLKHVLKVVNTKQIKPFTGPYYTLLWLWDNFLCLWTGEILKGLSHPESGRIKVRGSLEDEEKITVALHELAHVAVYDLDLTLDIDEEHLCDAVAYLLEGELSQESLTYLAKLF